MLINVKCIILFKDVGEYWQILTISRVFVIFMKSYQV